MPTLTPLELIPRTEMDVRVKIAGILITRND